MSEFEAVWRFAGPARGFMGKFKGKYVFQEDDPAERERQEQRLDTFLTKIRPLVTMKSGESFAKLTAEARKDLIGLFGEPTAHAMAEAAESGAVLWTDDLAVAEFGRERIGIVKRVWTQMVFRSVAPPEVHHDVVLFLLQWRYFFTRVEPDVVLAACRAGSWDADAPVLKSVADWLQQPELADIGALQVCVQSLRLVWKHGPDPLRKQRLALLLLRAVRHRKDGRRAVNFIMNGLGEIFKWDKSAQSDCAMVINAVQQSERTPGEIATSRSAWARAVRQIQRKNVLPDTTGTQTKGHSPGTAKQRADRRKAVGKKKKKRR